PGHRSINHSSSIEGKERGRQLALPSSSALQARRPSVVAAPPPFPGPARTILIIPGWFPFLRKALNSRHAPSSSPPLSPPRPPGRTSPTGGARKRRIEPRLTNRWLPASEYWLHPAPSAMLEDRLFFGSIAGLSTSYCDRLVLYPRKSWWSKRWTPSWCLVIP